MAIMLAKIRSLLDWRYRRRVNARIKALGSKGPRPQFADMNFTISGEYNVYCKKCHDHHPRSMACGAVGVIRRVDEALN